MNLLTEFKDDIAALERVNDNILPYFEDEAQKRQIVNDLNLVISPLKDGEFRQEDVDTLVDMWWWQKFQGSEIAAAKEEAAILRRLAPLYLRLESASDEEWEEYAKMRIHARLQSPLMRFVLKQIPSS